MAKFPLKFHCLDIYHPQNFEEVHAVEIPDGSHHQFIAVFGKGVGVKGLVGALIEDNHPKHCYHAEKLELNELFWALGFTIRHPIQQKTNFHVFVGQTGAPQGVGNRALSVQFFILPPKPPQRGNIPIQYPQASGSVGSCFTAWGQNGPHGYPTAAVMDQGNGNTFSGTLGPDPGNGLWYCLFANVPDFNNYSLKVSGQGGPPDSGENDGIIVNSASAPPNQSPQPPSPPS